MPGIVIEIVGDERSYLRAVQNTLGANTKLDASFRQVVVNANLTADAQIKAAVRMQEALKINALALSHRAATLPVGSAEQSAATLLAADAQTKYARSIGITTTNTHALSGASKTAERDLNKTIRGGLAGSGVFSRLGRSLAFASSGFIAVAVGASVIAKSITAAGALAKAQASLDVAIKHTGGDLAVLRPRYLATAEAAAKFGISETDALAGLAQATVLTGSAAAAQRAYQEALVISKATGKDFSQVLIATSKAQIGQTASLRRYGILVPTTSSGTQQLTQVMARFGGQAEANTSKSDKLRAAVANFEATLGTLLLPTFDRLATRLTTWLQQMEKSGTLQKDVTETVHAAGAVFQFLGDVVKVADKVTGSFANTVKVLLLLKVSAIILRWAESVGIFATAEAGATTETAALTVAQTELAAASVASGAAAGGLLTKLGRLKAIGQIGITIAVAYEVAKGAERFSNWLGGTRFGRFIGAGNTPLPPGVTFDMGAKAAQDQSAGHLTARDKEVISAILKLQGQASPFRGPTGPQGPIVARGVGGAPAGPQGPISGDSKALTQAATFQLTLTEQLAQAKAALTTSTVDDVAAAKVVLARIRRLIAKGNLSDAALLQALQAEATALGTIQSAAAAAKAKKQAATAKAQAAATTYNIPIDLQIAQARLDAYGKDTSSVLKQIIAAAKAAIASGKKHGAGLVAAYGVIQSAQQQLDSQAAALAIPARLQLDLAKEQALGTDQTATLRRMKAALERALKKAKGNIQAQTTIWTEIGNINQQLGSSATSALGEFKQLNLDKIAKSLHLTVEQAKKLKAQLSQVGPGRTVPGTGVGAYGYALAGGGTVKQHHHHHHHLVVEIDGQQVESSVRHHSHKRRNRNSSQRRGPNAGRGD